MTRIRVALASLAVTACAPPSAGVDTAAFSSLANEAARCAPGDACVLAGASDCTCARPVNAARADEVQAAADALQCCEGNTCMYVSCKSTGGEPACVDGECSVP